MTKLRGIIRSEPGKHRLHFHLFQICIYLDALSTAIALNEKIRRFEVCIIGSDLFGVKIEIPMPLEEGAVAHAIADRNPVAIEMRITDNDMGRQAANMAALGLKKKSTNGFQGTPYFFASVFVMFWDLYVDDLKAILGKDYYTQWPPILNFARVIRNACAHGGRVYFTNMTAASVHWHHYQLSPTDNGRVIIGDEFHVSDVMILLFEISDEMDRLGIPNR